MINTDTRYGSVTKIFHWAVFLLLLNQFIVAVAMLNTGSEETTVGFTQGNLYDWHKSIGLITLGIVLLRFVWRRTTPLPDWAPNLTAAERQVIQGVERTLYLCLFVMPISGFVFVMAGDYGVRFFSRWDLPSIIGVHEGLALVAQWTHALTASVLVVALIAHWGVGIRHQMVHRDRYLQRMLPFTRQR